MEDIINDTPEDSPVLEMEDRTAPAGSGQNGGAGGGESSLETD